MDEEIKQELTSIAAQLRHAYKQLAAAEVSNQRMFAMGLVARLITRLEKLTGGA